MIKRSNTSSFKTATYFIYNIWIDGCIIIFFNYLKNNLYFKNLNIDYYRNKMQVLIFQK